MKTAMIDAGTDLECASFDRMDDMCCRWNSLQMEFLLLARTPVPSASCDPKGVFTTQSGGTEFALVCLSQAKTSRT